MKKWRPLRVANIPNSHWKLKRQGSFLGIHHFKAGQAGWTQVVDKTAPPGCFLISSV